MIFKLRRGLRDRPQEQRAARPDSSGRALPASLVSHPNDRSVILLLIVAFAVGGAAAEPADRKPEPMATVACGQDGIALPSPTNAVQFRLFANAAPEAPHRFNTFELKGYGATLLPSAWSIEPKSAQPNAISNGAPHNILINGLGPELSASNSLVMVAQAAAAGWQYVALDVTAAYRDRVELFERGILFVEPDLYVLYDHLIARASATFQLVLKPPAEARLDSVWGDLRLELPTAGLRIHAPSPQRQVRNWRPLVSSTNGLLSSPTRFGLGPTNKMTEFNLVTVFAVHRGGEKRELAFRLLEGNNAIGARIHRDGFPTLVAFRVDPAFATSSLTGFVFEGPVGVDVFKPKQRPLKTLN